MRASWRMRERPPRNQATLRILIIPEKLVVRRVGFCVGICRCDTLHRDSYKYSSKLHHEQVQPFDDKGSAGTAGVTRLSVKVLRSNQQPK